MNSNMPAYKVFTESFTKYKKYDINSSRSLIIPNNLKLKFREINYNFKIAKKEVDKPF